jgi:hypothetical protein
MDTHLCRLVGKQGELIYICSRCGKCYACKHKAVYFDQEDKWMWKCPDGKFRPCIFDGRLQDSPRLP